MRIISRDADISTRGFVDTANPFICGRRDRRFRHHPRAIGPDLEAADVANSLPDPVLELRDSDGVLVMSNDDYVAASNSIVTGDSLEPGHAHDAIVNVTLPAGAYTAVVYAKGNASGVALVEFYDLSINQEAARARPIARGDAIFV